MSLKATVQVVGDERFALGEGPHWDAASNKLYLVDIFGGNFVAVDVNQGSKMDKIHVDSMVSFIIPYENEANKFIVSREHSLCQLDWSTQELKELTSLEAGQNICFNDAKCDRQGRLWAGTLNKEWLVDPDVPDVCNLYSFNGQQLRHHIPNVGLSNGIGWSPDGRTMFYVDSAKRKVFSFSFDEASGSLSNQQVFFDFNGHPDIANAEAPDGLSVDATGNLWLACFDGGRILNIDGTTGTLLNHVAFPVKEITSVCFGGPNLSTLFVTSAKFRLDEGQLAQQPLAGALFQVHVDQINVRGSLGHKFVQ
ncbi:Regucalcin [Halotydeus destructor]|nr:Regucalcin [Halotydeus destructor]